MKKTENVKPRGRPKKEIKKDNRLFIPISDDMKNRFQKLSNSKGIPMSIIAYDLIRKYIEENEVDIKKKK